ncbi:MAG: heme-copper oxidase subunit III [Pyrinomonadaceae bacterium]
MKVGTAEPIIEIEEPRKRRRPFSGGGPGKPSGSNGGGGDGGGNDSYRNRNDFSDTNSNRPDRAKVITWFLLLVVMMTFGGLIAAYVVVSTNKAAEWNPFDLPIEVWISTFLILVSSFAYHTAKKAIDGDAHDKAQKWLIATTVFGAAFISSQLLAWLALVNRGLYMHGNPYAGFFYILTAVHALHVLGGIMALGSILLRNWHETANTVEREYRRNLARAVGWYWHFMGALWIVLFILLGFWK